MKKISFYMNVAASAMLAFALSASMQSCSDIVDNPVDDPTEEPTDPENPAEEEEAAPVANADEFLAAIEAAEDGDTVEVAAGAEIILNDVLDLTDKSIVILADEDNPAILAPSSRGILTNTSVSIQNFIIEAADIVENSALINLDKVDDVTTIDSIALINVEILNLHNQLIYANKQKYIINKLAIENSVVGIKGATKKTIFDFNGGGLPVLLSINNSTIWADDATVWQNGGFYSTQSGSRLVDLGIDENVISITNSTLYGITKGIQAVNTLRQNSQAGQQYIVKNSIIANCGQVSSVTSKDEDGNEVTILSGVFLKGLNARQAGKDANWDIDGNVFNYEGEVVVESKVGASDDNIKNSIEKVVKFTEPEDGDFTQTDVTAGDPRWVIAAE